MPSVLSDVGLQRCSSSRRYCAKHVVRRQGSPDALERELTHWLNCYGVLDFNEHSRADEYLTRLGFVAKARRNIGYRADGCVIEPTLEADCAESGEAVRNTDAEANVVPEPMPLLGQRSDGFTHFKRHQHSLEG